jgi:repressor LexA
MTGARILDGDLVYIRRQETVEDGQIAAVLIGQEATLKRVYRDGRNLILQAENPVYKPIILPLDGGEDVRILGLAVAFVSRLR